MDQKDVDIWGITDSWEDSWHLHSYFLVLNQTALRSAFFEEFWGDFRYIKQKSNVINSYEIGFSGRAREAGLRCSAYCDYSLVLEDFLNNPIFRDEWTGQKARVEKFSRKPHNSSHFFWATMIKNFDCPFLKVELLRDNPSSVPDVSHWRSIISQFTDYDPSLIEQHLKMSGLHLEEG